MQFLFYIHYDLTFAQLAQCAFSPTLYILTKQQDRFLKCQTSKCANPAGYLTNFNSSATQYVDKMSELFLLHILLIISSVLL